MIAKEEKNRGRKLIWGILTLIIIGLMFFGKNFKDKAQSLFKQSEKTLEFAEKIDMNWLEDGKVRNYEDFIINANENAIISYDLSGNKLWSKDIDPNTNLIYLGEKTIYIGNRDTGQIDAINPKGENLWTYNSKQPMDKLVERNELLIIYTKAGEQIDQINIIDEEGSLIANTIVDKGKLLSSNVSLNRNNFAISTIDFSEKDIKSSVLLYTIEGEFLWKKDFTDWIVLDLMFMNKGEILLISDDKILCLSEEGELLWSKILEGRLKNIEFDSKEKNIYLLYTNKMDYLEIINTNGKTKNKIELNSNHFEKIYRNNKTLYITGSNELMGMNEYDVFLGFNFEDEIDYIGFENNNLLIFTKDKFIIGKLSAKKNI